MPAAPAAPPSAPAKPAAVSPTPAVTPPKPGTHTPPPASERDPADWMGDVGADLDALSAEDDAKVEGRSRSKPAPKPAAKPGSETPPEPKPGETEPPADDPNKPKSSEAAPTAPEPELKGIAAVREAYQGIKKKVSEEYVPAIQRLEARVKELEGENPPEVKALSEQLTAAVKRRDELEQHMALLDYEKSKPYQDNYVRPFTEAWSEALADFAELQVENEDGSFRRGTEADLLKLANSELGERRKLANALFGEAADDAIAHVRKVVDLSKKQRQALENAKTAAVEHSKTAETERRRRSEQTRKLWTEANHAIETKWSQMFAAVEGDQEGNALLDKGEAAADRLFNPATQEQVDQLLAEGKTAEAEAAKARLAPKTPEEAVRLHAFLRQKIRNHDRLALWHKRDLARIKELEAIVADYEKSDPSGGLDGGGGGPRAGNGRFEDDANAEIDALDKAGR